MHHFAWVVIGLPGCQIRLGGTKKADANDGLAHMHFDPDRAVKFLVPPGAVWGMSAGAPVLVQIADPRADAREGAVFEVGDCEWSRNLMHAVLAVDTLDAKVCQCLTFCHAMQFMGFNHCEQESRQNAVYQHLTGALHGNFRW